MASRSDTEQTGQEHRPDARFPHGVAALQSQARNDKAWPLHIHIVTLFVLLVIAVGGVITWYNHVEDRKLIVSA